VAKKRHHTAGSLRPRTSAWAVASALALAAVPLTGGAAGLGKVTVYSALGQPLRAELEVFASREELAGMRAQVASPDTFRQAGVEFSPTLSGITLTVDKRANGQSIIRLTSAKPINDPFVDLLLELNWPTGRLVREYTFLLDPPDFAARSGAAAAPVITPPLVARPAVEARVAEAKPARVYRPRGGEAERRPADGAATYEVKRGDTLGSIAKELRPEGVSLDQMLLALFRANQDAFDQGNINRLKAGKILSVPDRASVEAVPREEARSAIVAQSTNWGAYRQKLATVAADSPARDEAAKQQVAGRITTRVEDKASPPVEPRDQLKVSKTELPGAKPQPSAAKRSDEDLIAKEKALKDANERLASLERNVAELQRLVELKSQNLAELERQAAARNAPAGDARKPAEAPPPPPAAVPAPAPVRPEPPPPAAVPAPAGKASELPAEAKPAEAVARPETRPEEPRVEAKAEAPAAAVEAPKPVEPAKPADMPKARAVMPPPPEEPGFFEELLGSTGFLAGSAGIAALLGAYWFAKRRRESDGELPLDDARTLAPTHDSIAAKSVFRSTGGQSVDTTNSMPHTDFSQAGPGSIDTDEVDPVAEADVYMAYGRDAQAEEILLEAKLKDPRRHAIHLKLLEIYASRKDAKPFGLLATELFNSTGGVGADWEKAVAMGRQFDPGNPLFASAKRDEAVTEAPVARAEETPEPTADTVTRPEQVLQMASAAAVAAGRPEETAARAALAEARPVPADVADLDFDLGASQPAPAPAAAANDGYLETTLAFSNATAGDALDFDLAASLPYSSLPAEADHREDVQLVDDASSLEETVLVASAPKPETAKAASDGLDFAFDLSPESPGEPAWEERTLTQGSATDDEAVLPQALEFDLALDESPTAGKEAARPTFDMSSINLDLASTDVQVGTATVIPGEPLEFSFDEDQEDTLVNADFSMEKTDAGAENSFGVLTDVTVGPEISSSEEVATKIDLAKAYQEMGDIEGARELLQEVVNEGDAVQRETALALLSGLRE